MIYASQVDIRVTAFDDPDAAKLIDAVRQEYLVRYGNRDATLINLAEFASPRGLFVVGYLDSVPVACGGWRMHDGPAPQYRVGDAELKRMYVAPRARGKGFARGVLAELERSAAAAGRIRVILETGTEQPEALALYRSSGYTEIPGYGLYREDPRNICFGKDLTR